MYFIILIKYLSVKYFNMKVIISGAGICGLTLAITAKRAGLNPVIIERSNSVYTHTFGGGIGLWPPSQMVYQQLGLLDKLRQVSGQMPNPYYLNEKGWKLGQPSRYFHKKYKILCLERESLNRILYQQCQALGISVHTGINVINATSYKDHVDVELSNGQKMQGRILIGADGINSTVRNIIMRERRLPQIKPSHCGYAYFRAVVDLSKAEGYSSNGKWHKTAFQSWGEQKRFGYVPLKEPKTFWFFAVPLNKEGLSEYLGSHTCTSQEKQWILKQLHHWNAPIDIKQLISITPPNYILRTDIRKIKNITQFPWTSKNNNMLIIGDAANATAPNLAQGAGLAIESAWDLVSMVNFQTGQGIEAFLQRRRTRATTVQNIADMVAKVGQISQPFSSLRDIIMAGPTKFIPKLEQYIFESAVRYSLGGSSSTPHWLPSFNKSQFFEPKFNGNILQKVVGKDQFEKLPRITKQFRSSFIGSGSGLVSVKSGLIGKIFSLPPPMQNQKFEAYVDVSVDNKSFSATQKWTRIFGYGTSHSTKYSTIHQANPDFHSSSSTGLTLTQSLGNSDIRRYIKFGYDVKLDQTKAQYKSNSLWFCNYRLPIPSLFLPKSSWIEEQIPNGWKFDGIISLPLFLGGFKFFQYKGSFIPQKKHEAHKKKVVIAGGTGFIGSAVAKQFYSKGWQVVILSRKAENIPSLPFAKIVKWIPNSPNQQKEIDNLSKLFNEADVIINLAGENPGANRWNDQTKEKIIKSRLSSIELISKSFKKSNGKAIFIQASAAGIYGNRGSEILNDEAESGPKETFRVNTCIQLEQLTKQSHNKAIIARIGHVFGQSDGIFPFIRLSSKLRAKKFGKGGQYIPWVHVQDVANALYFMANNSLKFEGKQTNIVSPDHKTYDELYQTMGEIKNRNCYFSIPQGLLRIAMGQLSSVVLESQRMHPLRLIEEGFKFKYQKLSAALLSRELL